MMKKAVFVIGVYDRVAEDGINPLSDQSAALLKSLADDHDLEVLPVVACPMQCAAGLEKVATVKWVNYFRPSVLKKINDFAPDYVFCFGRVAAGSVLHRGNVVLQDNYRRELSMPDVTGKIFVVDSLMRVAAQAGIEQWIRRHIAASLEGFTGTEWGEYTTLLPSDPEWHVRPDWLMQDIEDSAMMAGFDLETYPGLSPWDDDARIRMGMLSGMPGRSVVVQCTPDSEFPEWFLDIVSSPGICKAGSNIAFDMKWMDRFGYGVDNVWDTSVAEHLIDETNPNKGLKDLTYLYLPRLGDYSAAHRALVKKRGGWQFVDDDEQYDYAAADAEASVASGIEQRKLLFAEGHDRMRAVNLSMELYPVLAAMQARGICFDTDENTKLHAIYDVHLSELRKKIQSLIGPINPASPKALAKALKKHVPGLDLTTGKLIKLLKSDDDLSEPEISEVDETSTDKRILRRERHKHPVIAMVLEFRKWDKLFSTYVKSMAVKHVAIHGGKQYIHASFNQNRTGTHRLSSSQPNMQNIPRNPGEDDPPELNVKRQFISRWGGGSILEADYSQAELRVAAMLSKDKKMIAALTSGRDVHKETAAMLLKKEYDDITKDERQRCKTLNFLILYGGGANTLSDALDITKDEAKEMLRQYFKTFPQLRKYIDNTHKRVRQDLCTVSPFGFKRRFREPPAKPMPGWVEPKDLWRYDRWNQWEGWAVQRKAFNMVIQNSAACYTFMALIALDKALSDHNLHSVLCGTVHDSILVDVHPGEEDEVAYLSKRIMETILPDCMPGTVPMLVDVEIGKTWGDQTEVKLDG